jgi:Sec-independent protein translocase protein TatA
MATNPTSYGSASSSTDRNPSRATPDLASDAGAIMDEAKSAAGKVVDEAKEQVENLTDRAKSELSEATEKAKSLASDQKEVLAEQVGGVAEAMGRTAADLERGGGQGAHYARMIADNAEKLSATIRDNDVDQLLGMAQDFGRRQPALFVGAAALLGFAASRFVLASAKRREEASVPTAGTDVYQEYAGEPASAVTPLQEASDVAR